MTKRGLGDHVPPIQDGGLPGGKQRLRADDFEACEPWECHRCRAVATVRLYSSRIQARDSRRSREIWRDPDGLLLLQGT